MSVQEAIQQINELEPKTQQYIKENLATLVEDTFLFECRAMAFAANLPDKFIDGLAYIITGPMSFKLINTWGSEEKPLAKWFNDGTTDHWIAPLGDYPLHWKAGDADKARNASAIFFESAEISEGQDMYSYGHMVSGLPATHSMERAIERAKKRFLTLVLKNSKSYVTKELNLVS